MTVTIKRNQTIETQVELPPYFTTLEGWYYMALADNKLLHVTDHGANVYTPDCLKYIEDSIKPCSQDIFIFHYCNAINRIAQASGIEHLPLKMEVSND